MAKKSDKTVNAAGDAVQQEMTAENGSSEQATAKQSSKKSKKDKNAASTSENVTSNMDEDIPVPQLNEDGSIATAEQAPASTTTADTTTEKSKKRKRKDGEATTGPEGTTSAEALPPKEKTKKSKKSKDANATDTSASAQAVATAPQQQSGIPQEVLAAVMAAPVPALEASTGDDASKKKEKKKKSKKDKSGTAAEDGADNNTEMQVDTVNPVASTSSAPANASTESTHVVNSAETGQEDNGKKKRKKKDKEVVDETAGGDETTDKSKKKKKKDKEASATNVSAPSAVEPSSTLNISANPAGLTTARRDRQSTSPLPELRLPPFPPPPPAASTSIPAPASTSISASVPADYENIDPSLRPTSRTPAPSSITPGGGGMPIARSTSMTGSTSIQPRDPSMPPPGTTTSGPILPTMPTPTADNNGDAAPKKRGRPKKIVPDAVPASAPGSNANANSATQLVPAVPSAAPAGRGISASAVPPSGRAPGSSVSPNMSTSNLPASTASTSAIAPSSTALVPAAAAAAPSSSTSAAATISRLSSSTNIFSGVNPNTLARAAMNPDFVPATLPEGTTPLQPSENKETHQELLASRWLNTKDMADLIEKEGLKVRTGKFSKAEDAALKLCIENYRKQQGLTQEQIDGIIFAKGRNTRADYGDFWTIVTRAVPDRALMSVYHHTKRIMQTDARKGPWSAEEDAKLKSAYKQFGPSWIKVSAVVGRWENDCRDRWRAYVGPNERIQKGKWSKEEEDKLRETIRQVKIDIAKWKKENANGAPIEDEPAGGSDMFWSRVATKMGTRSRHQCRIKWNDHMRNKLLTADGKPVRWAKRDTFILVMKLHSLQLTDEDEIAWKLLPDSHWNWWSPHVLHKRWFTMKQRAKKQLENENASYSDIINWLKKEQDRIPRKEVKAFMAKKPGEVDGADEDGDGEDDDGEEEEGGAQANAGTSAAPESTTNGTAAATQRTANGPSDMRKKKAQDQSQFRTSEFVNSSDEED